jgi:AraC-like DNA-binding protein
VSEIAFDLGYTDASNFSRAFRAKTGVSPTTFRDNLKGMHDTEKDASRWRL